jgi:hypothetical protein
MLRRIRANPTLAVAVAVGALLVIAWVGWAVYAAADRGPREGIGVLIAWPALLVGAALVAVPFVGSFLLIRRRVAARRRSAARPEQPTGA